MIKRLGEREKVQRKGVNIVSRKVKKTGDGKYNLEKRKGKSREKRDR